MSLLAPFPRGADEVDTEPALRGLRLRGEPWGLRLVDGQTCTFMTGATDVVDGMRLNYDCSKVFGIGVPDRSTVLWQVDAIDSLKHPKLRRIAITEAIF